MTSKIYEFKFQNVKAMRYMALLFTGIPFIFLLDPGVRVWVFMLVLMGPMALGFGLFILKVKAHDVIRVEDSYLDSSYFGKVSYDDILSISSPLPYAKPCIQLKLKDGRKMTWALNFRDNMFHGKEDLDTFLNFTQALEGQLKKTGDKSLPVKPPVFSSEEVSSGVNALSEKQDVPSLAEQLEKVKQQNNSSKWVLPIGLVFALLALVRTCGKDWFKSNDFNGPEMVKSSEKLFERTSAEAKLVLEKLVVKSGPYFLYSNDSSASLTLLPALDMGNPTGISAFKYVSANKSLRAFIDHPDSAELNLYIMGKGNRIEKLTKSSLNSGDSTKTWLYFRAYDPELKFPSPGGTSKDSVSARAFDIKTGVPLQDTVALDKAISEAFPGMKMMLANVKFRPSTFKLYLAGKTGSGMNEGLFRKAVHALNKQMHAAKVDTSVFKLKIFNKNRVGDQKGL